MFRRLFTNPIIAYWERRRFGRRVVPRRDVRLYQIGEIVATVYVFLIASAIFIFSFGMVALPAAFLIPLLVAVLTYDFLARALRDDMMSKLPDSGLSRAQITFGFLCSTYRRVHLPVFIALIANFVCAALTIFLIADGWKYDAQEATRGAVPVFFGLMSQNVLGFAAGLNMGIRASQPDKKAGNSILLVIASLILTVVGTYFALSLKSQDAAYRALTLVGALPAVMGILMLVRASRLLLLMADERL